MNKGPYLKVLAGTEPGKFHFLLTTELFVVVRGADARTAGILIPVGSIGQRSVLDRIDEACVATGCKRAEASLKLVGDAKHFKPFRDFSARMRPGPKEIKESELSGPHEILYLPHDGKVRAASAAETATMASPAGEKNLAPVVPHRKSQSPHRR